MARANQSVPLALTLLLLALRAAAQTYTITHLAGRARLCADLKNNRREFSEKLWWAIADE